MDFLVNDLSVHRQFYEDREFREAVARLMNIRTCIKRFGRELSCNRNLVNALVRDGVPLIKAVNALPRNEARAVLSWLTGSGSYWEESRIHPCDAVVLCEEEIVTNSAVAEAAFNCAAGLERAVISLTPSGWLRTPLFVDWVGESGGNRRQSVENHWEDQTVLRLLEERPPRLSSWEELEVSSVRRFTNLTFSDDAFEDLRRNPFSNAAAERLIVLLHTLDRSKAEFTNSGERTAEGQKLYQDHFTGDKAWFSDSSSSEKSAFSKELTFRHPSFPEGSLLCGWHGKVKTPQLRIHFSWPIRAFEPLVIVYVGPKLTKG